LQTKKKFHGIIGLLCDNLSTFLVISSFDLICGGKADIVFVVEVSSTLWCKRQLTLWRKHQFFETDLLLVFGPNELSKNFAKRYCDIGHQTL